MNYPDCAGGDVASTTSVMVASFRCRLPAAEFHLIKEEKNVNKISVICQFDVDHVILS